MRLRLLASNAFLHTTLVRFEKSYHFSCILQQMCNNLVKKIHVHKGEPTSFNVNAIGIQRVKKCSNREEEFPSIFYKTAGK